MDIAPIARELLAELNREKLLTEGMIEGVRLLVERIAGAQAATSIAESDVGF